MNFDENKSAQTVLPTDQPDAQTLFPGTEPPKKVPLPSIKEVPPFTFSNWLGFLFAIILPSLLLLPLFWRLFQKEVIELNTLSFSLFLAMGIIILLEIAYALFRFFTKKGIHRWIWIIISFLYSAWVTICFMFLLQDFDLSNMTQWLFVSALAMIPLFYSMIQIIFWLTPKQENKPFRSNLLPFILVPIVWYLLINLWRYSSSDSVTSIVLLITVVATYFFIFALLRIIYLIARRNDALWKQVRFVLIFIFPILAFAVTQLTPHFSFFWDYSSPIYYVLVVLNGVLLLIPEPKKQLLRLLLFFAQSALYLIVTYFFIVISPFYTLSLVGIIIAGIGLLVLSPLFLWVYQTKFLIDRGKALFHEYGGIKTIGTAVLGLALVPLCLVLSFQSEKTNFHRAVALASDFRVLDVSDVPEPIDTKQLGETMQYTNRYPFVEWGQRPTPPIITQLHNSILGTDDFFQNAELDNLLFLMFANQKIQRTNYDDFDEIPYSIEMDPEWVEPEPDIRIKKTTVETTKENGYYKSMVHFTLENTTEWGPLEYRTTFDLPKGVFISDYYLDVFEERKSGILAEKSSANWVYDSVTRSQLDPGLLNYDGEQVLLKVFPFGEQEIRYTGIEFLHKEPITLTIDGTDILLAPDAKPLTEPIITESGTIYLSTAAKENLPLIKREPRYLFVVDCSYDADVELLVELLEGFIQKEEISLDDAQVTALNYQRKTWSMSDPNWKKGLLAFPREGQFAYALALEQMYEDFDDPERYPLLVLVQDQHYHIVWSDDTTALAEKSPEIDGYFRLQQGSLEEVVFKTSNSRTIEQLPVSFGMRNFQQDGESYSFRDDGMPTLLVREDLPYLPTSSQLGDDLWLGGLALEGDSVRLRDMSEVSEEFEYQAVMDIIEGSFNTGLMTTHTSYIVLETQEQEEAMLRRQAAFLDSGSFDEFYERDDDWWDPNPEEPDPMPTSEPTLLLSLVLIIPLLLFIRKKRKRNQEIAA